MTGLKVLRRFQAETIRIMLEKIVSGGQTGVDRGALDAALGAGLPCGGWCPPGREAEDGVIPDRYPLQCMEQGGYWQRTRRNVIDSDGTLIVHYNRLSGGTRLRGDTRPCRDKRAIRKGWTFASWRARQDSNL